MLAIGKSLISPFGQEPLEERLKAPIAVIGGGGLGGFQQVLNEALHVLAADCSATAGMPFPVRCSANWATALA